MLQPKMLALQLLSVAIAVLTLSLVATFYSQVPNTYGDTVPSVERKINQHWYKDRTAATDNSSAEQSNSGNDNALLPEYARNWLDNRYALCSSSRYIAVSGTFGRFANNIITMLNGLKLALMTNRTLLLPLADSEYSAIDSVFDVVQFARTNGVCLTQHTADTSKYSTEKITGVSTNTRASLAQLGTLENTLIKKVVNSVAQIVEFTAAQVFYFGLRPTGYFTEHSVLWPLRLDAPCFRTEIREIATQFQKRYLAPGYTAVHVRSLENGCKKRLTAASEQAKTLCDLTPEKVDRLLHTYGSTCISKEQKTCFYFGSDAEDAALDEQFRAAGYASLETHLHNLKPPPYINTKTLLYALDIIMFVDAGTFIGNPASSLTVIMETFPGPTNRTNIY